MAKVSLARKHLYCGYSTGDGEGREADHDLRADFHLGNLAVERARPQPPSEPPQAEFILVSTLPRR
ncbi:hypothetical protein [Rhodovulum sulfidophilum]|uniref:hypothetical protein n=1 Tax=Rhodovulum sulfidophilum TaxID=35806 RepID=UPI003F6C1564